MQQDEPQNSPVNASTVHSNPSPQSASFPVTADFGPQGRGTPATGYIPGFDYGSGYQPTGLPVIPSTPKSSGLDMGLIAAGALGLIGLAFLVKKKPGNKMRGANRSPRRV